MPTRHGVGKGQEPTIVGEGDGLTVGRGVSVAVTVGVGGAAALQSGSVKVLFPEATPADAVTKDECPIFATGQSRSVSATPDVGNSVPHFA